MSQFSYTYTHSMELVCGFFDSRGHSSLLPSGGFRHTHKQAQTHELAGKDSIIRARTCFCSIARTCACVHACSHQHKFKYTGRGLHALYHSNIASDSNSSIACLVVVVVSVIQEQLLRRPWTQTSFLPGACHWQTQAWRVSFLWVRWEGLSLQGTMAPAHATHQPQPKSLTWPQKPGSTILSLDWQYKKTLIIQLQWNIQHQWNPKPCMLV